MEEKILEQLASSVEHRISLLTRRRDVCKEMYDLIMGDSLNNKNKIDLLVELYRYTFYIDAYVSFDPRMDSRIKSKVLSVIERAIKNDEVNDELFEEVRKTIDIMRDSIDDPTKIIAARIEFYESTPDAIL